jgi:hypothetical protein
MDYNLIMWSVVTDIGEKRKQAGSKASFCLQEQ